MITGKLYDQLKFLAQVLLPALGTLYVALAGLWGLPAAEQVGGSILAVDTFLGVLLHLSSNAYNSSDARFAGAVTLPVDNQDTGNIHFKDVRDLQEKDQIVLKVNRPDEKTS